jgi:hypothetical protein
MAALVPHIYVPLDDNEPVPVLKREPAVPEPPKRRRRQ